MSRRDEQPLVVPIAPIEAEAHDELRHARETYPSFRSLPWVLAALMAWVCLDHWSGLNALFWRPKSADNLATFEGTLVYKPGYRYGGHYLVRTEYTQLILSCAPGMSSVTDCSARYSALLDEATNEPVRATVLSGRSWLGDPQHMLVRLQDRSGRYITYDQWRFRQGDFGWSLWLPVLFAVVVLVPGAVHRRSLERRQAR